MGVLTNEDLSYLLLFAVTLVFLCIMFYNNVIIYKSSLKDHVSVILIASFIGCISDLIWDIVYGRPSFLWLNLLSGCAYALAFMVAARSLNLLVMERLGITIHSKLVFNLLYTLPVIITIIGCVLTPKLNLMVIVGEEGLVNYTPFYKYFYMTVMLFYGFSAMSWSLYYLIKEKKKDSSKRRLAVSLLIFAGISFFTYVVQDVILRIDYYDFNFLLVWAICLMYLTTNVNTDRFIESRERIAAVEADLNTAADIQAGSLPSVEDALSAYKNVKVYATMDPAKTVGGDFFDFFDIDDSHVCFVIADVSGKGIPAALFMMITKTMIKDHARMQMSTAEIFTEVNKHLTENNEAELFVTAWIGVLDTDTRIMRFTNAGHCAPFIRQKGKKYSQLKCEHDFFLTCFEDTKYSECEIQLEPGDAIFLYTDGVTEAHNINNQIYGSKRLLDCLNSSENLSGQTLLRKVKQDVLKFSEGMEQFDDITMMTIDIV